MTQEESIWIVTDDFSPPAEGIRGDWSREVRSKGVQLSVEDLEQKMTRFLQTVGRLFQQADQQANASGAGMKLNEVELCVEISAEGEIKLVAGVKAAGRGAITLKFTRNEGK